MGGLLYIINCLIENQIGILVIGNNPNWKQGILVISNKDETLFGTIITKISKSRSIDR